MRKCYFETKPSAALLWPLYQQLHSVFHHLLVGIQVVLHTLQLSVSAELLDDADAHPFVGKLADGTSASSVAAASSEARSHVDVAHGDRDPVCAERLALAHDSDQGVVWGSFPTFLEIGCYVALGVFVDVELTPLFTLGLCCAEVGDVFDASICLEDVTNGEAGDLFGA